VIVFFLNLGHPIDISGRSSSPNKDMYKK